jgi:signal transduction histidine kinase
MSKRPPGRDADRRHQRRLVAGLVLAFAVMVFAALVLLGAVTQQEEVTERVTHSRDILATINSVVTHLSDAENGKRGYALSGQRRYHQHYTNGLERVQLALDNLRRLTRDDPDQAARGDELQRLIELRKSILAGAVAELEANGFDAATQTALMVEGQDAMEPIRRLAAEMIEAETFTLQERLAAQEENVEGAKGFAVLVSLFALLLFPVLLLLLVQANRRRRRAEEELERSNAELEERVRQRTRQLEEANTEVRRVNGELETRVQTRTAELEEANQELESFSYSVSHDLRAPLRHIQGYAEMLDRAVADQLNPEARRYLRTVLNAGTEMNRLIDDLLAFSRIGRGEMPLRRVSLDDLVRDTIAALELPLRDRRVEWRIGQLPAVLGDPGLLRQVWANLIGNAVKYSQGRDPAVIDVGSEPAANGLVTMYVRDNGAGFDMQYAHKLFGVFQRLHRSDEFEGTGIGLATVRRIIGRHGGRVWAEGAIDQGATFRFTLQSAPDGA